MTRYMMATAARHLTGDISRDEPNLAVIDGEDGDDYVGQWVSGLGLINVRFPKSTTRDLTDEERALYSDKVVQLGDATFAIGAIAPGGEAA